MQTITIFSYYTRRTEPHGLLYSIKWLISRSIQMALLKNPETSKLTFFPSISTYTTTIRVYATRHYRQPHSTYISGERRTTNNSYNSVTALIAYVYLPLKDRRNFRRGRYRILMSFSTIAAPNIINIKYTIDISN